MRVVCTRILGLTQEQVYVSLRMVSEHGIRKVDRSRSNRMREKREFLLQTAFT